MPKCVAVWWLLLLALLFLSSFFRSSCLTVFLKHTACLFYVSLAADTRGTHSERHVCTADANKRREESDAKPVYIALLSETGGRQGRRKGVVGSVDCHRETSCKGFEDARCCLKSGTNPCCAGVGGNRGGGGQIVAVCDAWILSRARASLPCMKALRCSPMSRLLAPVQRCTSGSRDVSRNRRSHPNLPSLHTASQTPVQSVSGVSNCDPRRFILLSDTLDVIGQHLKGRLVPNLHCSRGSRGMVATWTWKGCR